MRFLQLSFIICIAPLVVLSIGCAGDETVTIGATFPLTGDNALYGINIRNGMELALEEINAAGGIAGKPLRVIYLDDQNDPKVAAANLRLLSSVHGVSGVVGSAGSNCTLAMAPVADQLKTVIISPTSSQSEISFAGPFTYRTCPSDVYQVEVIVDWMVERGHSRVGILFTNNSWGLAMKDAFVQSFTNKGGSVLCIEGVAEQEPDLRSPLTKIAGFSVDALFMPTYSKQGGRAVREAAELGISVPLLGGDPWDVAEFLEAAGDAAQGCMYTVFSQYQGEEYQRFAAAFEVKYGQQPDYLAASGYDDLKILSLGLQHLLSTGLAITGENLRHAIDEMPAFMGATGHNGFDSNGDVVNKTFVRKTYSAGQAIDAGGQ